MHDAARLAVWQVYKFGSDGVPDREAKPFMGWLPDIHISSIGLPDQ